MYTHNHLDLTLITPGDQTEIHRSTAYLSKTFSYHLEHGELLIDDPW